MNQKFQLIINNLIIIYCFILLNFNLNHGLTPTKQLSKLNIAEFNNYQYQVDIDKSLKIDSTYIQNESSQKLETTTASNTKKDDNLIKVRSKHGQLYECKIPDLLNEFLEEDMQDSENNDAEETSFFEFSKQNSQIDMSDKKSQYNFTLINEKIHRFMADLNKSGSCIYRVNYLSLYYNLNINLI